MVAAIARLGAVLMANLFGNYLVGYVSVGRHSPLQDFDFIGSADLPHQVAKPVTDFAGQDPTAILRHPQMVLDVVATANLSCSFPCARL